MADDTMADDIIADDTIADDTMVDDTIAGDISCKIKVELDPEYSEAIESRVVANLFHCARCDLWFGSYSELGTHVETHCAEKGPSSSVVTDAAVGAPIKQELTAVAKQPSTSGSLYDCSTMKRRTKRIDYLVKDLAVAKAGQEATPSGVRASPRNACVQCKKSFFDRSTLNKHIKTIHGGWKLLTFKLGSHARIQFNRKGSTLFVKKSSVDDTKDKLRQSGERPCPRNICTQCNRSFFDRSTLNKHVKTIHCGRKRLTCSSKARGQAKIQLYMKSSSLSLKNSLVVDLDQESIAGGKRPCIGNTCTQCNKSFYDRGTLRRHLRNIHSFVNNSSTVESKQKVMQNGERPYTHNTCARCQKSFYDHGTLLRHIRNIHFPRKDTTVRNNKQGKTLSGQPPYAGNTCALTDSAVRNTKQGITSSGQPPYAGNTCAHCNKNFYDYSGLRRHIKKFHLRTNAEELSSSVNVSPPARTRQAVVTQPNPRTTCTNCNKNFYDCSGLRRHIRKIHLRTDAEELSSSVDVSPVAKTQQTVELVVDLPSSRTTCTQCKKQFFDRSTLNKHVKSIHGGYNLLSCSSKLTGRAGDPFYRKVLSFSFKNSSALRTKPEVSKLSDRRPSSHNTCTQCSKSFYDYGTLQRHIRNIHSLVKDAKSASQEVAASEERSYPHNTCAQCNESFLDYNTLNKHIQTIHSGNKESTKFCLIKLRGQGIAATPSVNNIAVTKTKPEVMPIGERSCSRHSCAHCYKDFYDRSTLMKHVKRIHSNLNDTSVVRASREATQTGKRPYTWNTCTQCNKQFYDRSTLQKHIIRIHTGQQTFPCIRCGEEFDGRQALRRHVTKVHSGKKPIACAQCDNEFFDRGTLRKHMKRIHGDQEQLTDSGGPAGHIRSYEDKLPHSAEVALVAKSLPEIKSNKTMGQRPYACNICTHCNKIFYHRSTLKKHIKRLHSSVGDTPVAMPRREMKPDEEQPYSGNTCTQCQKSFYDTATMRRHMRNVHAIATHCPVTRVKLEITSNGKQPYTCNVCTHCNRNFYDRSTMQKHQKRVTRLSMQHSACVKDELGLVESSDGIPCTDLTSGERPYADNACAHCGVIFFDRATLHRHINDVHSGAYIITESYADGISQTSLHNDGVSMTGECGFECGQCGLECGEWVSFKTHMSVVHPGVTDRQAPPDYDVTAPLVPFSAGLTTESGERQFACADCDSLSDGATRVQGACVHDSWVQQMAAHESADSQLVQSCTDSDIAPAPSGAEECEAPFDDVALLRLLAETWEGKPSVQEEGM